VKCSTCHAECTTGAFFCSRCGCAISSQGQPSPAATAAPDRRLPNAYPYPESLVAWKAVKTRNLKAAFIWGGLGVAAAVAVGFAMGGLEAALNGELTLGAFAAFATLIATTWVVTWVHRVSSRDYYLLPHARDASGEHRCIFCGNRGIYRRGQYKTNNTLSSCSKCQQHLFTE
jgi:hypothetical protein